MLLQERSFARLLLLSHRKKVVFLTLLYCRMIDQIRLYCAISNRDFSIFEQARDAFWKSVEDASSGICWSDLRDDILDALPPDAEHILREEDFMAMHAALVAYEIAGLLEDGEHVHVRDALQCAHDSADSYVVDRIVPENTEARQYEKEMLSHPIVERERRLEEEDLTFMESFVEAPWTEMLVSELKSRAKGRLALLEVADV